MEWCLHLRAKSYVRWLMGAKGCFQNSFEGAKAMAGARSDRGGSTLGSRYTSDTGWWNHSGPRQLTKTTMAEGKLPEQPLPPNPPTTHPHPPTSTPPSCQIAIITLAGFSWRILDAFPIWPYWYPPLSCLGPLARRSTWSNSIYHRILNILWECHNASFQRVHEWRILLQITHLRPEPRLLFCIFIND